MYEDPIVKEVRKAGQSLEEQSGGGYGGCSSDFSDTARNIALQPELTTQTDPPLSILALRWTRHTP